MTHLIESYDAYESEPWCDTPWVAGDRRTEEPKIVDCVQCLAHAAAYAERILQRLDEMRKSEAS